MQELKSKSKSKMSLESWSRAKVTRLIVRLPKLSTNKQKNKRKKKKKRRIIKEEESMWAAVLAIEDDESKCLRQTISLKSKREFPHDFQSQDKKS